MRKRPSIPWAAVAKAQDDLKTANGTHDAAVTIAEQQYRKDVADANAELKKLPVMNMRDPSP